MSEKAPHRVLAAPIRSSPSRLLSSIRAANILTSLAMSGRLVEMVLTAAPTALWSVLSCPVRVTICAVAADKLGRPVRIMLDRDEDMLITGHRHSFLSK